MTKLELMQQAYDAFDYKKRDNGETFTCLKDNAPQWLRDGIQDIHGGDIFPNDWRYSKINRVFEAFCQYDDVDKWVDYIGEIADSLVDIYNHDCLAWVTNANIEDVNDAMEMIGEYDIIKGIQGAQYEKISGFADMILQLIDSEID